MDYKIILVYCLCADLLKAFGHKEDVQCLSLTQKGERYKLHTFDFLLVMSLTIAQQTQGIQDHNQCTSLVQHHCPT